MLTDYLAKQKHVKITYFQSNVVFLLCQCNQSLLDFFDTGNLQIIFVQLYDSLDVVLGFLDEESRLTPFCIIYTYSDE